MNNTCNRDRRYKITELKSELTEWVRRLDMTPEHHTALRRRLQHNINMARKELTSKLLTQ